MNKYKGQCQVEFNYSEHLGPRMLIAGLKLDILNSDHYEFASSAIWPKEMNYDKAIESGVCEALLDSGIDPSLGIKIIVQSVNACEIYSSEKLFYRAAHACVKARFSMR
jgi:hypothetical protein